MRGVKALFYDTSKLDAYTVRDVLVLIDFTRGSTLEEGVLWSLRKNCQQLGKV